MASAAQGPEMLAALCVGLLQFHIVLLRMPIVFLQHAIIISSYSLVASMPCCKGTEKFL